jgi:hypothetical protein
MRLQLTSTLLGLALITTSLAARSSGGPADDAQPFKVTAELISQKYCWSDSGKAYSMIFKIHMRLVNQTDRKLIVSKDPGHGMFWVVIATDAKHFGEKDFEYDPNVDWDNFFVGPDGKGPKEELDSPGSSFAILAPGKSLQDENEYWTSNLGPLPGFPKYRGALQPGSHVVGVSVSSWPYHAKPEEIHKRWEPFGDLVYKNLLVGPLQFNLSPDPKIEKCDH